MAKHYYNVEIVSSVFLDEEDVADLEEAIQRVVGSASRVNTEYVDSEG